MHPSDERARQSFIYLNILTPDCYNHIDKLPATRLRSRDAAHRRRTNRSPVFTPIVSYHSTLIASPEQISHATQYFQQQASVITTYHQTDGASSTTNPSVTNLSAAPAAQEQGVNTTAESALLSTAAITTSHILLSRGVKDDPSLPSSLSTSPTQQEGRGYNSEDIAVTSIWESNNKRVMTFLGPNGGSGLMSKDTTHPSADERSGRRYGERRASDKIWDGEGELPAEFQTMRDPKRDGRSEESSRKANEWLGLTSRTKSACTHTENDNLEKEKDRPTTRPRRDMPEDYDIPDLPNLMQPMATRMVSDLEDRTWASSYDSLGAQRSWPSISDFGGDVDNIFPQRGRSVIRTGRVQNPFSRASSRKREKDLTIEVNVRFMEPRLRRSSTFFDDPLEPVAKLEDKLLEPLPRGSICASVSEVLSLEDSPAVKYQKRYSETALELAYSFSTFHSNSGTSISLDPNRKHSSAVISAFTSGRTTHRPSCTTPHKTPKQTSKAKKHEFNFKSETPVEEQLHVLPLSPYLYSVRFKEKQPGKTPVALTIPAEIMHHIYLHLGAVDFDAARHVCRLWYINSLEYSLLDTMLRRGGWSSSVQRDLAANRALSKSSRVREEWLMSKHLARECALGPDWRGNGMQLVACDVEAGISQEQRHSPFKLCSRLDFRSAGVNYVEELDTCGMLFTVSSCSKFLMVSQGSIVYIYELNRSHRRNRGEDKVEGGALRPLTSIICPRRVLACSMDTSSNRDAIAILMDGRMGLVCAVTGNSKRSAKATHMGDLSQMQELSNVFPVSSGGKWRNNVSHGTSNSPRNYKSHGQRLHVSVMASEERLCTGSGSPFELGRTDDELDYHFTSPTPRKKSANPKLVTATYPMPIEASPPTLYALLCSADDPPRSVALCPQRRCVAFGCSSGIELHWVDALTGEDLNRWFPLTAPSDYLYFLPPRAGIDSAKKLRLVSSQGSPAEKATISERFSGRKKHSAFWGVDDVGSTPKGFFTAGDDQVRADNNTNSPRSDHYLAVPLSDGYHLLFTDPASGVLCLGNDAPFGGPTKLLRKLWFSGPAGEGSPIAYSAASDLRWGVRVVAAYGLGREQSIWLFSVPADVFTEGMNREVSAATARNVSAGQGNHQRDSAVADWVPWWGASGAGIGLKEWPSLGFGDGSMMWPVMVRGQKIGHCSELADLAVHSGPEMGITIWAFGRQGVALTWNVKGRGDCTVKHRWVVRDGTVREGDGLGDVEMLDSDILFPHSPGEDGRRQEEERNQRGLRGTASASYDGAFLSPDEFESPLPREDFEKDTDGDVPMQDLLPTNISFGGSDDEESDAGVALEMFEAAWRSEGQVEWEKRFSAYAPAVEDEDDIYPKHNVGRRTDRDEEFFGLDRGRWDEVLGSVQEEKLSSPEGATQGKRRRNVDLVEELTGDARIDFEIR